MQHLNKHWVGRILKSLESCPKKWIGNHWCQGPIIDSELETPMIFKEDPSDRMRIV
jgi:hypothetical protein